MASREVNVNPKVDDLIDVKAIVDKLRAERDAAVARAEAAEQAVQRVRTLHGRNVYGELDYCVICVYTEGADYPCDTIRALDGTP